LGERLNGIQEVVGSIPISSTRNSRARRKSGGLFFLIMQKMSRRIRELDRELMRLTSEKPNA
jgi:hypothetical protein